MQVCKGSFFSAPKYVGYSGNWIGFTLSRVAPRDVLLPLTVIAFRFGRDDRNKLNLVLDRGPTKAVPFTSMCDHSETTPGIDAAPLNSLLRTFHSSMHSSVWQKAGDRSVWIVHNRALTAHTSAEGKTQSISSIGGIGPAARTQADPRS